MFWHRIAQTHTARDSFYDIQLLNCDVVVREIEKCVRESPGNKLDNESKNTKINIKMGSE